MAIVNGEPGFTQYPKLNLTEKLTLQGVPILPGGNVPVGVLSAQSTATQNPTALDTPIQIEFGAAQGGPSDPVQIDANGTVTVNQAGGYQIIALFSVTRDTGGGEAYIFIRGTLNGTQTLNSIAGVYDDGDETVPLQFVANAQLNQGDTIVFQLYRDSQNGGANNGGLTSFTSTIGWNPSSSASLQFFRYA